jgi:DNA-binding response OmpR family regulator
MCAVCCLYRPWCALLPLPSLFSLSNLLSLPLSTHRQSRLVDEFALPIVGMSANSDSYSKDCALQAGMNLFLAKPFTIGELQGVLGLFTCRTRGSTDIILET